MNLKPLGTNVLIEPIAAKKETASGILLPGGEKTGVSRARVLATAHEVRSVEVGDVILYESNAPSVDAGEGRRIISIDYLMAVLA